MSRVLVRLENIFKNIFYVKNIGSDISNYYKLWADIKWQINS